MPHDPRKTKSKHGFDFSQRDLLNIEDNKIRNSHHSIFSSQGRGCQAREKKGILSRRRETIH